MAGTGYAVGPALGGVLFQTFNLSITYRSFSIVPLLILALTCFAFSCQKKGKHTEEEAPVEAVPWRALFIPKVAAACLSITMTAASYGFLDVTLSPHLTQTLGFGSAKVRTAQLGKRAGHR